MKHYDVIDKWPGPDSWGIRVIEHDGVPVGDAYLIPPLPYPAPETDEERAAYLRGFGRITSLKP